MRFIFLVLLFTFSLRLSAQKKDTVYVKAEKNVWVLQHKVKAGEQLFDIAKRYHVPPSTLTTPNGIRYQDSLAAGRIIKVPLGTFNFMNKKPATSWDSKQIYYKATVSDDLYTISSLSNVPVKTMREWNKLDSTDIKAGRVLMVGWVKIDTAKNAAQAQTVVSTVTVENTDRTAVQKPAGIKQVPVAAAKKDTVKPVAKPADTLTQTEKLYLQQTNNEKDTIIERGSGAFFIMNLKTGNDFYYAFHNTAPKGTIIKLTSPGSGKTVYVKVLGKMPNSKQYFGAVIGISSMAKAALGADEEKVWCELSYASGK